MTLVETLAKNRGRDTPGEVEPYALFDVVANTLGEIKAENFLRDSG